MHAKSLQSCLTVCDPMDCSLSGFSVHGILQARILVWVAFPPPTDLPEPGIKPASPVSPVLQADSLSTEPIFTSVQSLSCVQLLQHTRLPCLSPTPRACSNSCPIESAMPFNHLILCRPLFLLPSIFPSIRVFSNESALHIRWPRYWRFTISPSNEHPGLISFRVS